MKKLLALVLALCMVVALSATAFADSKTVTVSIGYENNPGENIDLAVNRWKELLEERSGGTMKVELYPSSQLGSKNDLIDQMIAGDNVITLGDGGAFIDRGVPDMAFMAAYGTFDSWDEVWKLIESEWFEEQCQKLEDVVGVKILAANWIYGIRHILSTKPIKSLDDMKGLKIRVPTSSMHVEAFELMGASPVSMNLGEVYTALQQGVVEALENPLSTLYNGKFQEVAKYLTLDGHSLATTTWFCGTQFYNSLTAEQQQWLCETAKEAGLYNNELALNADDELLQKFINEGVEVIEMTDEEKAEFLAPMKDLFVNSETAKSVTPGLYDTIMPILKG